MKQKLLIVEPSELIIEGLKAILDGHRLDHDRILFLVEAVLVLRGLKHFLEQSARSGVSVTQFAGCQLSLLKVCQGDQAPDLVFIDFLDTHTLLLLPAF